MTKEEQSEEKKREAQEYLEAYHLLTRAMDAIGVFMDSSKSTRKSSAGKTLERAYIMLREDFFRICDKHPELNGRQNSFFKGIPILGGSHRDDMIMEWAEGAGVDYDINPQGFPDFRYTGEDGYDDELAVISEKAYLSGVEKIEEVPEDVKFSDSYYEAYEAMKQVEMAEINDYALTCSEDGEILINDFYRISGIYLESGSNTSNLMKKIKEEQDAGKTKFEFEFTAYGERTTAQTINDLGITPLIRKIFFNGTRGDHICFRSPVSRKTLLAEGIDPNKLRDEVDLKIVESRLDKIGMWHFLGKH